MSCPSRSPEFLMEAFWISTGVVAIAEIGDKTQLLAIVLAAKFRRPLPIILGILAATLLNHAAAAYLGQLIASWLDGATLRVLVGLAFLAMAGWALVPDGQQDGSIVRSHGGVFCATLVAFFIVEIGDKTQIATSLLAAKFDSVGIVTLGTTAGMMLANVPAVYLAEAATKLVPLHYVRMIAALIFAAIGASVLVMSMMGETATP